MAHSLVFLSHDNTLNQRGNRKRALLRTFVNKAIGVLSGVERGSRFTLVGSGTDPAAACTHVTIGADPSGAVGAVINGVTLTDTWTTSATVSAGLVAVAVNASTNALIQHVVGATNIKANITLASVLAGTTINVCGFRFTAIAGTTESNKDGEFVIGGSDTADATSFCLALQRHPYASKWFFATNVAGVVSIFCKSAAFPTAATALQPTVPQNQIQASAATVTVTNATLAAGASVGVWAKVPGKWGNHITIAASGGNVAIENSNTRLTRGLGMDAAPVTDNI